jgi:hypothetical protein
MAGQVFTHLPLGQEVEAVAGHMTADKELRLPFKDREVLVILGSAVWDRSCCGVGGCRYATVPGWLLSYQSRIGGLGQSQSEVEPIDDEADRKAIQKQIEALEVVQQVNFW